MKAKEIKKLLAASTLTIGLSSSLIFTSCGCAYGPQEQPSTDYDPALETAVAEYGVVEILEESGSVESIDMQKIEETETELKEAPCVYGPAEMYDKENEIETEESADLKTLETDEDSVIKEYDPSKEEVPYVYGVQENYATE